MPRGPTCGIIDGPWIGTATSFHSVGVNVCRGDGSVVLVTDTIDATSRPSGSDDPLMLPHGTRRSGPSPFGVWGALGTANSGQSKSFP